jgi:hypothetical protein
MTKQVNVIEYPAKESIPADLKAVGGLKVADASLAPNDLLFIDGTVYSPGAAVDPSKVTWGGVLKTARVELPEGVMHVVLVVVESTETGEPWYLWFDRNTYGTNLVLTFF